MKSTYFKISAFFVIVINLFSFTALKPGSITGTVIPAMALKDVWVVSAHDTVRGLVMEGNFSVINVKPGTYKVIINAVEPYKDAIKEGITVIDGQPVDMGEIKLTR